MLATTVAAPVFRRIVAEHTHSTAGQIVRAQAHLARIGDEARTHTERMVVGN